VKLLRRLLYWQAALWLLLAVPLGLFPRPVLEGLFGQARLTEYAWVRIVAVQAVVLALLMILVAQKIEDLWWWSWAFAIMAVGIATVCVINAIFGLPPNASAVLWWLLGGVSAALGAGLLVGMGMAGQEKPFV
jgi:hypothetical protein